MEDYIEAHKYSNNNMEQLKKDKICGCFYCWEIFSPKEIENWLTAKDTDNYADGSGTAICPYCGIDSVIGESCGYLITKEFLEKMNKYWF